MRRRYHRLIIVLVLLGLCFYFVVWNLGNEYALAEGMREGFLRDVLFWMAPPCIPGLALLFSSNGAVRKTSLVLLLGLTALFLDHALYVPSLDPSEDYPDLYLSFEPPLLIFMSIFVLFVMHVLDVLRRED